MTKQEKIDSLGDAMTMSKRASLEDFYHFSDTAPEELKEIFQKHTDYSLKDLDFEIFSAACDIVYEIFNKTPSATESDIEDDIHTGACNSSSVYTYPRLQYLDNNNEEEISEIVRKRRITG